MHETEISPPIVKCVYCGAELQFGYNYCPGCSAPTDAGYDGYAIRFNIGHYDPELALLQFLSKVAENSKQDQRGYELSEGLGRINKAAWQRIAAWVKKLADDFVDEVKEVKDKDLDYSQREHRDKTIKAFVASLPYEQRRVFSIMTGDRMSE